MDISTPTAHVRSTPRHQRLRADLMLLVVAIIWGSAFVVQRLAAAGIGVYLFNGSRFLLGALALLPLALSGRFDGGGLPGIQWKSLPWIITPGVLLVAAAGLQQAGLVTTTAGNAGFITGLYVVFIPFILSFILRQKVRPVIWLAAGLSAVGMYMLSMAETLRLNPGDLLELIGAVFWGLHVIVTDRAVKRLNVLHYVIGQYLVCGLLNIGLGLAWESATLPILLRDWWVVAYTGLLSVGLGYTLQAVAQRHAPPADAAILLSLESVFAALAGWIFLSESLTLVQFLGCVVMFAAMVWVQVTGEKG
jgi:drug/metabolite transporter (DMT)-like permease